MATTISVNSGVRVLSAPGANRLSILTDGIMAGSSYGVGSR